MIDARGLSCPEPVIMVKEAMESKADKYEVMVDNRTSFENVSRYAGHQGYKVDYVMDGEDYHMTLTK